MRCIGGGIDVRQCSNILAGLRTMDPCIAKHVTAHTGWNTESIAHWLTPGPPPPGVPASEWQSDWRLHCTDALIKSCVQGFDLRFHGDRTKAADAENSPLATAHPETTTTEIANEIAAGRIIGPFAKPPLKGFRVVPGSIKQEATKSRPISQGNLPIGNAVNDDIPKMPNIQLASMSDIDRFIRACHHRTGAVWIAKAGIKAAYRTAPVQPQDWHIQGVKWLGQYFIDLRLSFGCRSSVDNWLMFAGALHFALARWGVHALFYVDDFIFIGDSEEDCQRPLDKFREICKQWGVELKHQHDCGPSQTLTVLGIEYDLKRLKQRVSRKVCYTESALGVSGAECFTSWYGH